MTDQTVDRLGDRPVDRAEASVNRQHASADVAPELFEERPGER